jgi:hypothetical protein
MVTTLDAKEGEGGRSGYCSTQGTLLVPQGSEMKYALKRLITGLGVGRETARPCYSLALAQVRRCSWQGLRHAGRNGRACGEGEGGTRLASELMRGIPHIRKCQSKAYLQKSPGSRSGNLSEFSFCY